MKKINLLLLLSTLLFALTGFTQPNLPPNVADSLWQAWQDKNQPDTNRLKAIHKYVGDGYLYTKPDSAFYYAQLQYNFAKSKKLKKHMAVAFNTQGISFYFRGDYAKAIEYYTRSLKIREEIGDKQGIAASLNNIGLIYNEQSDYAKAIEYHTRSLKINEEIGDKKAIAVSLGNIGNIYKKQGDYVKAIEYHTRKLKIDEKIGNKKGIATSLGNIGNIYFDQGDYAKAIEYQTRSLKMEEEIGNKQGIASSLSNIGNIYFNQGDYSKAIDYYTRSLKINEEIRNKQGIAFSLNNIGVTYKEKGDYSEAINYLIRSLKINEEIASKQDIATSLNNIGNVYSNQGNYAKAIEYQTRSLKINEEIGANRGIITSLGSIGIIYKKQGNYIKAIGFIAQALSLAKEIGAVMEIRIAAMNLWEINKKLGKHKEALEMHELYIQMKDSIESEENAKEVIRQEFKYNYEKKAATDSVANAKANEIKNAQIAKQKAEIKAKRNQQYALYGGLVLVLLFAVFVYNRLRITNKQKAIIETQKHLVEEKHKEITDSINYAERIQRSFLATKELLDANLNEYFVFFKPKDVVSGDFYWAATSLIQDSKLKNQNEVTAFNSKPSSSNLFYLATADSTGHGVPGAIMSLLNITSLEKAIETETAPHLILNKTRTIIIDRLKKDGSAEGGKDGMDCSLLVFNKENNVLQIAAANNPVWIVRASTSLSPHNEVIEIKPDKMPVGKHDKQDIPFTLHEIQLQKGDVIYTLTDGFPDQFGGEKGKKFMSKKLRELLAANAHLPMNEQKQLLETTFANWKKDVEQVDDVTVIGVRV